MQFALLLSVFVIATCGLVYELISSTLASYLLGDSVLQFSTVIGVYLFSMGIGSYLSRFLHRGLVRIFIQVELLIALIGGWSAAILFFSFEHVSSFRTVLYLLIGMIGTLVGLEIPILMRILKDRLVFKDLVSKVFTFDYVGALLASLIFPLFLVPHLGLVRSSFLFGIFNAAVALWTLIIFGKSDSEPIHWTKLLRTAALLTLLTLGIGFAYADRLMQTAEANNYPDRVVFAKSTPYQRIVLTRAPHDVRLYLNNNLQFSSRDEYRYHESLVHVGLALIQNPHDILVLGGGDGMAVREALKYPSVEHVTLVDLDGEMTKLFHDRDDLVTLNGGAFLSPKVRVINADAFNWLRENEAQFDFVILDFPDPSNYSLGKLFSTTFYRELSRHVRENGAAVVQSTSPFVARKAYWCVDQTLRAVGFRTVPYHVLVPSFGDWGFILASKHELKPTDTTYPADLRFLTPAMTRSMLEFPKDIDRVEVGVNRLDNQQLVRYFEEEWSEYTR
jgi:spermidine synthase